MKDYIKHLMVLKKYLPAIFICISCSILAAPLPPEVKMHTDAIDHFMIAHPCLSDTLRLNAKARKEIFDHFRALTKLIAETYHSTNQRSAYLAWLEGYINRYPDYFKHSDIDYHFSPYLPQLRFQVWTSFYESHIREGNKLKLVHDESLLKNIAAVIGFDENSPLYTILVKHKRLFVENARTSVQQQENVAKLLSLIPKNLIKAESIRIRDHLGMQIHKDEKLQKRSGVNIFTTVGLAVLAHELNHTINENVVKMPGDWTLETKKSYLLAMASGPDVKFHDNNKFDLQATKVHFRELGLWDGIQAHWKRDWLAYWNTGEGEAYNQNWIRQAGPVGEKGIPYFLKHPQEIIAGLSNPYFINTKNMFQLALDKWAQGYREPINQFLFFMNIYDLSGRYAYIYKSEPVEYVIRNRVRIFKDEIGNIVAMNWDDTRYEFAYAEDGRVIDISHSSRIRKS